MITFINIIELDKQDRQTNIDKYILDCTITYDITECYFKMLEKNIVKGHKT